MKEETMIRQRLIYTGHVQGVGFRFRAKYAAQSLGLTGWVKNEWDGSVTVEVQGTLEEIHEMMKRIQASPFIHIDWIERKTIPLEEHDTGFHVR